MSINYACKEPPPPFKNSRSDTGKAALKKAERQQFVSLEKKKSETEVTAGILKKKKTKNTQKVHRNAFSSDETRQNATFRWKSC